MEFFMDTKIKRLERILTKLKQPNLFFGLPNRIKYILIRTYHEKFVFKFVSKEAIFNSIWKRNYWGNTEGLSGVGSTLQNTENLRHKLPILFYTYEIKSVFDAP